jgi:hypothetical protein
MAEHGDTPAEPDGRLVAVRPRLLELHRQLLEAERARAASRSPPMRPLR